ncbi:hypothetical protein E2320_000727 [Naja naja]|nr:hypothetical protein E2320_000727 [Naja naja]
MQTAKMQVFYKHLSLRENPAEGQNVTFSVERVQGDIREVNWFRGLASQGSSRIFSFFPGNYRPQRNGVQFTNREFGFHNGSIQITGLKHTPPLATATTATMMTTATKGTSPVKEVPKEPSKLGWIVAGVLVGVLLCGALIAIMVYRFVLRKSEPSTGVTGKLDLGLGPLPGTCPKLDSNYTATLQTFGFLGKTELN